VEVQVLSSAQTIKIPDLFRGFLFWIKTRFAFNPNLILFTVK
jgi:hypothetical protein